MRLRFALSSRRHGVTDHQVQEVLDQDATIVLEIQPPDETHPDDRILFVGPDDTGRLLEVGAVETDHGMLIIHAMPARPRYQRYWEKWTP